MLVCADISKTHPSIKGARAVALLCTIQHGEGEVKTQQCAPRAAHELCAAVLCAVCALSKRVCHVLGCHALWVLLLLLLLLPQGQQQLAHGRVGRTAARGHLCRPCS